MEKRAAGLTWADVEQVVDLLDPAAPDPVLTAEEVALERLGAALALFVVMPRPLDLHEYVPVGVHASQTVDAIRTTGFRSIVTGAQSGFVGLFEQPEAVRVLRALDRGEVLGALNQRRRLPVRVVRVARAAPQVGALVGPGFLWDD